MAYATVDNFLLRVPSAACVPREIIQVHLDDAAQEIDDRVAGGLAVPAHVFLAAHNLASSPDVAFKDAGGALVSSMKMGEIAATFSTSATSADGEHSSTSYGRRYDALRAQFGHAPLTDLPNDCATWP